MPVYPVKGVVTYNGSPVTGADITFFNRDAGRSSFGRTNDKGEYQLTTFSSNDGAVEGKSTVTIMKFEVPPPAPAVASIESADYEPPGLGQSSMPPRPKSSFPEKFGNAETSGLLAVVNATEENNVDFKLTD